MVRGAWVVVAGTCSQQGRRPGRGGGRKENICRYTAEIGPCTSTSEPFLPWHKVPGLACRDLDMPKIELFGAGAHRSRRQRVKGEGKDGGMLEDGGSHESSAVPYPHPPRHPLGHRSGSRNRRCMRPACQRLLSGATPGEKVRCCPGVSWLWLRLRLLVVSSPAERRAIKLVRSAVMRRDGTDLACSIKVALPWNHGLASHVLSAAKRRPVERLVPAPIGAYAALTLTRATGSPRHLGAKIDRSESRCGQGSDLLL